MMLLPKENVNLDLSYKMLIKNEVGLSNDCKLDDRNQIVTWILRSDGP